MFNISDQDVDINNAAKSANLGISAHVSCNHDETCHTCCHDTVQNIYYILFAFQSMFTLYFIECLFLLIIDFHVACPPPLHLPPCRSEELGEGHDRGL
jgi:hypothetical protein